MTSAQIKCMWLWLPSSVPISGRVVCTNSTIAFWEIWDVCGMQMPSLVRESLKATRLAMENTAIAVGMLQGFGDRGN